MLGRPNRALLFVMVTTLAALAVTVPFLRGLFGFAPLGLPRLAEAAGAAAAYVPLNDAIGVVGRWIAARHGRSGTGPSATWVTRLLGDCTDFLLVIALSRHAGSIIGTTAI